MQKRRIVHKSGFFAYFHQPLAGENTRQGRLCVSPDSVQLPKSLEKDISLNTAAYSKARERIPLKLTKDLFNASRIQDSRNSYTHWHGYRVLIGDGTYVQMQDTESIRKEYEVKQKGSGSEGYPQGLLEVIIERGTG